MDVRGPRDSALLACVLLGVRVGGACPDGAFKAVEMG